MNFAAHDTMMNIKQTAMGVVLWAVSSLVLAGGVALTPPATSAPASAPAPAPAPAPASVSPNYEAGSAAYDAGDYDKARRIWQPLAEKGDVRAQRGMGKLYEKGRGVERDFAMPQLNGIARRRRRAMPKASTVSPSRMVTDWVASRRTRPRRSSGCARPRKTDRSGRSDPWRRAMKTA